MKASVELHEAIICLPQYQWSNTEKYRMMTSSNGNIFRVTGRLCGEFIDVFFDLRLNNGWVNNREADD